MRWLIILFLFSAISLALTPLFDPTPYVFPRLRFFPAMPTSSQNQVTNEGVELGRYLFYDPTLSKTRKMSCATCHKQEHAFSDAPNALSLGSNNVLMKRNTMPLFNLAWYPRFFWDGRAPSLEAQIAHPLRNADEMNITFDTLSNRLSRSKFYRNKFKAAFGSNTIDSNSITNALAQFLRVLISANAKYDQALSLKVKFASDELAGFDLVNDMTKGACSHCHTIDQNSLGTTTEFSNNGLDFVDNAKKYKDMGFGEVTAKEADAGKFKIPSLRNLGFTAPYMHDGRFKTLEEVIDFYSEGVKVTKNIDSKMTFAHRGGARLSAKEKQQIIAFLQTMNDSAFISNPNFSNPFRDRSAY